MNTFDSNNQILFDSLIKDNQKRMKDKQIKCSCGLELLVTQQQQLILKQQNQIEIFKAKSQTIDSPDKYNQLVKNLQNELKYMQSALSNEKKGHISTNMRLQQVEMQFEHYKQEYSLQQEKDYLISDRLTNGYQDLAIENTNCKVQIKQSQQLIEQLKIALNQANLNLEQMHRHYNHVSCFTQTDFQEIDSFQFQQQELKERINNQTLNINKFVTQYLDNKKLRNKSSNDVKFYSELQNMMENLNKANNQLKINLSQFINNFDTKDESLQQAKNALEELTISSNSIINQLETEIKQKGKDFNQALLDLQYANQQKDDIISQLQKTQQEQEIHNQQLQLNIQQKEKDLLEFDMQFKMIQSESDNERQFLNKKLALQEQSMEKLTHQYQETNLQLSTIQSKNQLLEQEKYMLQEQLQSQNLAIQEYQEKYKEQEQLIIQVQFERNKFSSELSHLQMSSKCIYDQLDRVQSQHKEVYDKYAEQQRFCGKLEEENQQLKVYSIKLQDDLQERNGRLNEYSRRIDQLEQQLYHSSPIDKSLVENNYLSSKVDDLQSIVYIDKQGVLKEKDNKIEEMERLYHLTSYELRVLQEYQDSLQSEIDQYKNRVQQMSMELEESHIDNRMEADEVLSMFKQYILEQKIEQLEEQLSLVHRNQYKESEKKPIIQVKILSGEIQRLNQSVQLKNRKIRDLQQFIEQMVTSSKDNQVLAKQILIAASQKGEIINLDIDEGNEQIFQNGKFASGDTFGMTISSLDDDT